MGTFQCRWIVARTDFLLHGNGPAGSSEEVRIFDIFSQFSGSPCLSRHFGGHIQNHLFPGYAKTGRSIRRCQFYKSHAWTQHHVVIIIITILATSPPSSLSPLTHPLHSHHPHQHHHDHCLTLISITITITITVTPSLSPLS